MGPSSLELLAQGYGLGVMVTALALFLSHFVVTVGPQIQTKTHGQHSVLRTAYTLRRWAVAPDHCPENQLFLEICDLGCARGCCLRYGFIAILQRN